MNFLKSGKNKIFVIFSLIIAAIISAGVYFIFVGNMADVIVVNQTVRGGTQISESIISTKKADKSSLPENYILAKYKDEIIGQYLDLGLTEGGVLTANNLSSNGKASLIQSGKVLFAMKDLETYPQNLIAGDKLNIIVASSADGERYVKTIEQVEVAGVHQEDGEITGVEIYVTAEEAQLIAFAQANGEVSVSLLPLDYETLNLDILDSRGFINAQ